jgi:hypothetical protein
MQAIDRNQTGPLNRVIFTHDQGSELTALIRFQSGKSYSLPITHDQFLQFATDQTFDPTRLELTAKERREASYWVGWVGEANGGAIWLHPMPPKAMLHFVTYHFTDKVALEQRDAMRYVHCPKIQIVTTTAKKTVRLLWGDKEVAQGSLDKELISNLIESRTNHTVEMGEKRVYLTGMETMNTGEVRQMSKFTASCTFTCVGVPDEEEIGAFPRKFDAMKPTPKPQTKIEKQERRSSFLPITILAGLMLSSYIYSIWPNATAAPSTP